MQDKNMEDKIKWVGIDGFLVITFFAVSGIIFLSLYNGIDFILGYFMPIVLLIIVTGVFISYGFQLLKFIKETRSKK